MQIYSIHLTCFSAPCKMVSNSPNNSHRSRSNPSIFHLFNLLKSVVCMSDIGLCNRKQLEARQFDPSPNLIRLITIWYNAIQWEFIPWRLNALVTPVHAHARLTRLLRYIKMCYGSTVQSQSMSYRSYNTVWEDKIIGNRDLCILGLFFLSIFEAVFAASKVEFVPISVSQAWI